MRREYNINTPPPIHRIPFIPPINNKKQTSHIGNMVLIGIFESRLLYSPRNQEVKKYLSYSISLSREEASALAGVSFQIPVYSHP